MLALSGWSGFPRGWGKCQTGRSLPEPPPPCASIRNSPSESAAWRITAGCTAKEVDRPKDPSFRFQWSHQEQQVLFRNWLLFIKRTLAYWKLPLAVGKLNWLQL